MNIKVEKNNLKGYGNEMIKYSEDFESCINQFASIIDSINSAWEGADALKYVNAMKEKYLVGLTELNGVIKSYADYLKTVPEVYTTLDEAFSSKKIDA